MLKSSEYLLMCQGFSLVCAIPFNVPGFFTSFVYKDKQIKCLPEF